MRKKFFKRGLFGLGAFSIGLGIFIILGGLLFLWPKARDIEGALDQSLRSAEESIVVARQNIGVLESAFSLGKVSSDFLTLLPETLIALNGTLIQGAAALESTGTTLDSLEQGITGIVLPSPQVGKNIKNALKMADQLTLLARMVREMREASAGISRPSEAFAERLEALNAALPAIQSSLKDAQLLVKQLRSLADGFPISLVILAIPLAVGGVYSLLGLLLVSNARLQLSLGSESIIRSSSDREESKTRKVA